MITLTQLQSKLNTHAVAAGALRLVIGYLEEHAAREARDMTTLYPFISFLPPEDIGDKLTDKKNNQEILFNNSQLTTFYAFNWNDFKTLDESLAGRVTAWDNALAIHRSFIDRIAADSNIQLITESYNIKLIPEGNLIDGTVAIHTNNLNFKVLCDV